MYGYRDTIDCQTKLNSQTIVKICGAVQAEEGKPQTTQWNHSTDGLNKTATVVQRLYSLTW